MTQSITTPKAPDDTKPVNSPGNLAKLAFCTLLYSIVQSCSNSFNGIVDWTKMPDMHTVHVVLHQMKPAAVLGSIRGVMLALMVVIVVWLGPPLWGIVGPILGSAARSSLVFFGAFARAMRANGPFNPKDPLDLHGSDKGTGATAG